MTQVRSTLESTPLPTSKYNAYVQSCPFSLPLSWKWFPSHELFWHVLTFHLQYWLSYTLSPWSTTAKLVVNPRMEAEKPKTRGVEGGQESNNLVIFPAEESWFRKDKMSTSRIGIQYWKITEKLKKLLKLTRGFGERTLLISAQHEPVCIIMFCSILSRGESHKLQWLNKALENGK